MNDDLLFALYGGGLIALSSSLNYILFGDITGLSGTLNVVFGLNIKSQLFFRRFCFVVGLVSAVNYWTSSIGYTYQEKVLVSEETHINYIGWIIGGILIGMGSRWSGGCTSGHGVCGLPRFSIKSLVAICIFMPSGIATATYLHSNPLFPQNPTKPSFSYFDYKSLSKQILTALQLASLIIIIFLSVTSNSLRGKTIALGNLVIGAIFGSGLLISGMCNQNKILGFLTISNNWDGSLLVVMFSAVLINLVTFQGIIRMHGKPLFGGILQIPSNDMDIGNYVGPVLFGMGWGITGLCPGPAIANLTITSNSVVLILSIFIGQSIIDKGYDIYYSEEKIKYG